MIALNVVFEDPAWPDLANRRLGVDLHHTQKPIAVSAVPDGMASGAPSVCIRIELENGNTVLAETSLALFLMAADMLKARYGDPRLRAEGEQVTAGRAAERAKGRQPD